MALDVDAVMIAGSGDLYTGPVGSTLPTNVSVVLDAALINAGYLSTDGATFRDSKTREPINAWQSFRPIKYRTSESSTELELTLMQFDSNTVPLAFGGGTIATVAGPPVHYVYSPAEPQDIDERAAVIQWFYAAYTYRLVLPRVMVTSGTETQLTRAQETGLPLTLGVLAADGVDPFSLITDDPAFAAA